MSSVSLFVGLDYHQAFIQVCILDPRGNMLMNRRCDNVADDLLAAVGRIPGHPEFAIEACCGAADLAEELVDRGQQVSLAHATYVHKLKQSLDKTDWSDARLLADLLRVGYLPRAWPPPYSVRQLRHIVRYRQQLADARRAAKLRVSEGKIVPPVRLNGAVRWRRGELEVWIAEGCPPPERPRMSR